MNEIEGLAERKPLSDVHVSNAIPPLDLNSGQREECESGPFLYPMLDRIHTQPSTVGLEGPALGFANYVPVNLLSVPDTVSTFVDATVSVCVYVCERESRRHEVERESSE